AALRWEDEDDELLFFAGTFLPDRRASDRPIAIACLRLFTFLPLRPILRRPRLNSCISRSTFLPALGLYLRRELDFRPRADELRREREPLHCAGCGQNCDAVSFRCCGDFCCAMNCFFAKWNDVLLP